MKDLGSAVYWAVALVQLHIDLDSGRYRVVFPMASLDLALVIEPPEPTGSVG